jgi:hypothetical protein
MPEALRQKNILDTQVQIRLIRREIEALEYLLGIRKKLTGLPSKIPKKPIGHVFDWASPEEGMDEDFLKRELGRSLYEEVGKWIKQVLEKRRLLEMWSHEIGKAAHLPKSLLKDIAKMEAEAQEALNEIAAMMEAARDRIILWASDTVLQVSNMFTSVFELQRVQLENQILNIERLREHEMDYWEDKQKAMVAAGVENSAYYKKLEKDHAKSMEKINKREMDLRAEAWEKEKAGNIVSIISNTAAGMMRQYKDLPYWAAVLTKILVGAEGAIQLAVVSSQQNPYKRAMGGLIPDKYGYGDSVPVLATGGEFVVNRQATRDNLELLEAINANKNMQSAGNTVVLNIDTLIGTQDYMDNVFFPQLNETLRKGYVLEN